MPADLPGVDRDDVKAAWRDDAAKVSAGECLQPPARGAREPALLGRADTVGGCAEARGCTKADFNEHEPGPIAHHQIELARRVARHAACFHLWARTWRRPISSSSFCLLIGFKS